VRLHPSSVPSQSTNTKANFFSSQKCVARVCAFDLKTVVCAFDLKTVVKKFVIFKRLRQKRRCLCTSTSLSTSLPITDRRFFRQWSFDSSVRSSKARICCDQETAGQRGNNIQSTDKALQKVKRYRVVWGRKCTSHDRYLIEECCWDGERGKATTEVVQTTNCRGVSQIVQNKRRLKRFESG